MIGDRDRSQNDIMLRPPLEGEWAPTVGQCKPKTRKIRVDETWIYGRVLDGRWLVHLGDAGLRRVIAAVEPDEPPRERSRPGNPGRVVDRVGDDAVRESDGACVAPRIDRFARLVPRPRASSGTRQRRAGITRAGGKANGQDQRRLEGVREEPGRTRGHRQVTGCVGSKRVNG